MRVFPMRRGCILGRSVGARTVFTAPLASCVCVGCGRRLLSGAELLQCSRCTVWQPPPTSVSPAACFTFYSLFSLAQPRFAIDSSLLKQRFVQLQGLVHPDRHANGAGETAIAAAWSVLINHAYSTMKDPLQRAIYLVNLLEGRKTESASAEAEHIVSQTSGPSSPELFDISEVLEAREAVETAAGTCNATALTRLKTQNDLRIREAVEGLCQAFDRTRPPSLAAARTCIVRLRYWRSIDEAIAEASL